MTPSFFVAVLAIGIVVAGAVVAIAAAFWEGM